MPIRAFTFLKSSPRRRRFRAILAIAAIIPAIGSVLLLTATKGSFIRSLFRNPLDLPVLGQDSLLVAALMLFGLLIVISRPFKNFEIPKPLKLEHDPQGRNDGLKIDQMLEADFSHASSEVQRLMDQRLDIVNYYILVAAGAAAAVVGLLQLHDKTLEVAIGPIFLLTMIVGCISLFQIITLRNEWFAHIQEMDHIRQFYVINQNYFTRESVLTEYSWKFRLVGETISKGNALYNYSAITIAFMNTAANTGGVYIIGQQNGANITDTFSTIIALIISALFFLGHTLVYTISLASVQISSSPSQFELRDEVKNDQPQSVPLSEAPDKQELKQVEESQTRQENASELLKSKEQWGEEGNTHWYANRYIEALAAYEQALKLDPRFAAVWKGKSNALWSLQRYDEALAAYEQWLQLGVPTASDWIGKGNALWNLQRYQEALVAYERALELDPKLAVAWHGKGNALKALGHNEEAKQAYERERELE